MLHTTPLRLSLEEMALLQYVLKIQNLPGISADLLDKKLSDEQRSIALTAARHALQARGFIGWRNLEELVVHPGLVQILLDYASPRFTLFVDTLLAGKRGVPYLYVFGERGLYEQHEPEPDILQFQLLQNEQQLMQRLAPQPAASPYAGFDQVSEQISQELLISGIKIAREDEKTGYEHLAQTLSQPLAKKMAAAYHQPRVLQYLACWEKTPTSEHAQPITALTLLQGQDMLYILWVEEPAQGPSSPVTIAPATPQKVQTYIRRVLPAPFLNEK